MSVESFGKALSRHNDDNDVSASSVPFTFYELRKYLINETVSGLVLVVF